MNSKFITSCHAFKGFILTFAHWHVFLRQHARLGTHRQVETRSSVWERHSLYEGEGYAHAFWWATLGGRHGWAPRVSYDIAYWHIFPRQHAPSRAWVLLDELRWGRVCGNDTRSMGKGTLTCLLMVGWEAWVSPQGELQRCLLARFSKATCLLWAEATRDRVKYARRTLIE